MQTFFEQIFSSSGFMPHGQCFLWQSPLIWLHATADCLTALAYYAIPLVLLYFIGNRQDIPFRAIFILFGFFIFSCGTTHLLNVWTLWHPDYWVSGGAKAITALISLLTVYELIPILPKALTLPSPAQLEAINQSLAHEIQERKEAETQVWQLNQHLQQQVQELERLHRLKDDFLDTVSHELRTPLASMRMAVQLLQDTQSDGLWTERQQRYLDLLSQNCRRETLLINDLLDLQRLEAGSYDLALEPIELHSWLSHLIQAVSPMASSRQQVLSQTGLENLSQSDRFHSDPACLDRILRELLNNAIKYTPPEGQIGVNIAVDPDLQITVRNSGEIPGEALPHLFDKFYRVPQHDPWSHGGTGLGLALIKQLVIRLQGEIHVSSRAGWTEFTLVLPNLSCVQQTGELSSI